MYPALYAITTYCASTFALEEQVKDNGIKGIYIEGNKQVDYLQLWESALIPNHSPYICKFFTVLNKVLGALALAMSNQDIQLWY